MKHCVAIGQAIRLDPDFAAAYNNRGAARYDKGDLDGALKDFDEAIRLDPDFAAAYNNRGAARYDEGDLDGALKDFDEAIRLDPDYATAYAHRGFVRGRWRSEVEEFPAALEQPSRQLHPKRNWAGAGIATVLAAVILAGTVLYSQQNGSLAALAVSLEDLVSVR